MEWSLVIVGSALVLFGPHWGGGDGLVRYRTLLDLAERGHLSSARYSIIQSILALPLYFLGRMVGYPKDTVVFFNVLVFLGGLVVLYRTLASKIDDRYLRILLLLLVAGSMFPYHVQWFYAEVLNAVAVFVGIVLCDNGRGRLGACLQVIGITNVPACAVGAGLVALDRTRSNAGRLRALWPVVVAGALILIENWLRRGSPFATGYENDGGFTYPAALGVVSILFSFGKGIVFFAPGLLLIASRARHDVPEPLHGALRSSLLFVAGLVAVYARWYAWHGDWFWGPRFFLVASFPASLLLAAEIANPPRECVRTLVTIGLVVLSLWVGFNGSVFGETHAEACLVKEGGPSCQYFPEFSVLIRPFVASSPLDWRGWVTAAYSAAVGITLIFPLSKPFVLAAWRRTRRESVQGTT